MTMACRPKGKFGETTRTYSPTIDIDPETQRTAAPRVAIDDADDAASDQKLIPVSALGRPGADEIADGNRVGQMGESAGKISLRYPGPSAFRRDLKGDW
jgi:hypothetical protein